MGYEIVWQSRGVIKRYFGHVTSAELLQAVVDTESDGRFDDLRWVINDFLDATSFEVDEQVIQDIAVADKGASMSNVDIKVAIVATAPDIVAAGNQYANSPLNAYPTRIFATLAAARAWLGLPWP
jgi:hypothetical protein